MGNPHSYCDEVRGTMSFKYFMLNPSTIVKYFLCYDVSRLFRSCLFKSFTHFIAKTPMYMCSGHPGRESRNNSGLQLNHLFI